MKLFERLRRAATPVLPGDALYRSVVAIARQPRWYTAGQVADTLDGRFDMVALILSLVMLRLEREGEASAQFTADLVERFVADMDGSLREIGVGDLVVGKHVGEMMGALGGRLGAYRDALALDAAPEALAAALTRNLYRGNAPNADALAWTEQQVRTIAQRLASLSLDRLQDGNLEDVA